MKTENLNHIDIVNICARNPDAKMEMIGGGEFTIKEVQQMIIAELRVGGDPSNLASMFKVKSFNGGKDDR